MSDKRNMIGEITEETIDTIKKRSAFALPDNPSASGMKPSEIKKAFWGPIISNFGSIYTELARVIKEANAALDALDKEDKRIAEDLLGKLSLAQSNFQTALKGHDSSDAAHADIREWLREVEALTETIKTWQNEGSDLPPAYSLVKGLYENFISLANAWSPLVYGSVNNIEYDVEKGDLVLYFNDNAPVRVELPLERLVGDGRYDEESRTIRLSLDGGDELVIPVGDLVDEYEGDGETVEVYRDGGVRKIRILPAFIKKRDETVKALGEAIVGIKKKTNTTLTRLFASEDLPVTSGNYNYSFNFADLVAGKEIIDIFMDVVFDGTTNLTGIGQFNAYINTPNLGSIGRTATTNIPAGQYKLSIWWHKVADGYWVPSFTKGSTEYQFSVTMNNGLLTNTPNEIPEYLDPNRTITSIRIQSIKNQDFPSKMKIRIYGAIST